MPFIDSQELRQSKFNFYCQKRETNDIRVMTVVRKNLVYKIVIDHKIDLISHLYFRLLEICKLRRLMF